MNIQINDFIKYDFYNIFIKNINYKLLKYKYYFLLIFIFYV